jgi:hypothetical protein
MDEERQTKWMNFIPEIVKKLNYRRNEATQFPPVEVFFGFLPEDNENLIRLLNDKHKMIMSMAYQNSIRKYNLNKNYYNRDKNKRDFHPGEIVMIKNHALSKAVDKFNAKLDVNWQPAVILKKAFGNAFYLKTAAGREICCDVNEIKNVSFELQQILKENENFF